FRAPPVRAGAERGQSPFARRARRVLRTNGDCPLSAPALTDYRRKWPPAAPSMVVRRTAEIAVEAELGAVVVGDGAELLAQGLVQRLDRLQHLDGQAHAALEEALEVQLDGRAGRLDGVGSDVDLVGAGLDLGVVLGH